MKLEATTRITRRRYLLVLTLLFLVEWVVLAIDPYYRKDWALENVLVAIFFLLGILTRHKEPLSKTSYTLIFAFLAIHAIGAHYTYSEVPYAAWLQRGLAIDINALCGWSRNHFDRLVHFCYGLLFFYPLRELCLRMRSVEDSISYVLPLSLLVSSSAVYELIEWVAALVFGGELGVAYLGTQGDEWDAHKDMALAIGGALTALVVTKISMARHEA